MGKAMRILMLNYTQKERFKYLISFLAYMEQVRAYYDPTGDGQYGMFEYEGGPPCKFSSGSGRCFVATAVYGNPHAEQVEQYRWLRKNILKKTNSGRKFVDWYENGGGQKMASVVKNTPTLRVPST